MLLDGHTQAVSSVCWPYASAIYSASWDHSIRLWDVVSGQNTTTWNLDKVRPWLAVMCAPGIFVHIFGSVRW